jgi:proteasome lid subunit RPN8/RPN11
VPRLTRHRASLAQEKIDLHLPKDGVEHGFTICQDAHGDFAKGPEAVGTRISVGIDVKCPDGYRATGLFHTHPGGTTDPSPTDIKSAKRLGISHLCIGVPETGEVACHDITRRCGRR